MDKKEFARAMRTFKKKQGLPSNEAEKILFNEIKEVNDIESLVRKMDKVFTKNQFVKPAGIYKNRNFKLTTRIGNVSGNVSGTLSRSQTAFELK